MTCNQIRMIGVESEADRILNKHHIHGRTFCEVGEDNICMGIFYKEWAENLYNFEVRNDDVYVLGFPRSGTTWSQEMIWLIVNNLDFEGAKESLAKRTPFLELDVVFNGPSRFAPGNALAAISALKSPRVIKSHLHWALLPREIQAGTKTPKMIFILRNPKDVCVSFFHLNKAINYFTGSFEEYCELFLCNRVIYGPFWKYVNSYWKQRNCPNILFIRYKDMIHDLPSVIKNVSTFLEKPLNKVQVETLSKHLQFDNMKKNCAVNLHNEDDGSDFFRKGKLDGHAEIMSPELIQRFDTWKKEELNGSDSYFD